jgi:hypothetical protein
MLCPCYICISLIGIQSHFTHSRTFSLFPCFALCLLLLSRSCSGKTCCLAPANLLYYYLYFITCLINILIVITHGYNKLVTRVDSYLQPTATTIFSNCYYCYFKQECLVKVVLLQLLQIQRL